MSTPGANTIEARALPFIERVENVLAELDSMKGEYMAACKAKRGDIKEIYAEVKDADLPVKAIKKIVKRRELERKQLAIDESMKGEEGEYDYEMLVAALGDLGELGELPLGKAYLDKEFGEEDVRPRFKQTDGEAPAKRGRKPKADAPKESPEEAAALADVESGGIGGAAASFEVRH